MHPLALLLLTSAPAIALAQGVTTAAVQGTLRISDSSSPDGARISVRNLATGFVVEAEVRSARFLIQGLEVGGPYRLTLRRIGVAPEAYDIGFLRLGEPLVLHLVANPVTVQLDSLVAFADRLNDSRSDGGAATTISDSMVHHLPTLNRDVYDFVRLVPQVSTRVGLAAGGMSAAGAGFRFNHFFTNGVPERSLSGSQPPEFAGGKSLPLEAVGEYQVLITPFDVRYGDFAGGAVNTVTRSGTNRLQGSAFVQYRNDALSGSAQDYNRSMYGFLVSGPISRDKVHFLVAGEFQQETSPMTGPYIGQPADSPTPVPVREEDLARLESIMQGYGLESGSGGAVENRNPLRNFFARIDAAIPVGKSRAALWVSSADAENLVFGRGFTDTTFALSSQASTTDLAIRTAALQVHTALERAGGGHNEFFLSGRSTHSGNVTAVTQPIMSVAVPGTGGGSVNVFTGPPAQTHGGEFQSAGFNLRDNLTLPLGRSHVATFGVEAEWFRLDPGGLPNSYGTWSFLSLDSLESGLADRFEVTKDYGGGNVVLKGGQYALYAGDHWDLGHVSLTFGLRADLLDLAGHPPYNPRVDSVFGRRTDVVPSAGINVSPRVGFTWSPGSNGRNQLRGGAGIFTGRPPLAWHQLPRSAYGTGSGLLRCGIGRGVQGPTPPFDPDPLSPPSACAGGTGQTPSGDVELLDTGLRLAQTLRGLLAWDHLFGNDLQVSAEALFTRNLSDFAFVNLNLTGPQSVDTRGRTLYGTIDASGQSAPVVRDRTLPSVIDVQNVSANWSTQLAFRAEKGFESGSSFLGSYTWTRARDVQTPLRVNNRGVVNWSSRAVSGRHEDETIGISLNDVPHRLVLAGTWRAPWQRWTTELSFIYVGESGSPFTYRARGSRQLGDLNADGSNANDPIYVPLDAMNPAEIVFSGLSSEPGADQSLEAQAARIRAQQSAFEQFIADSPCLSAQRGRILASNSCREPWSNTSVVSLRQRIPLAGQGLEAQIDLFNLFNLLNDEWGIRQVAEPGILEHVGQTTGIASQPVFRFQSSASPWTVVAAESTFQLQVGLRYRF